MKKKLYLNRKICVLFIVILLISIIPIPNISCNIIKTNDLKSNSWNEDIDLIINKSFLDLQFIYNITENLSKIIFTEYNESAGEIAKGRDFGTKGERKAAEIIFENMTKIGLITKKDRINNSKETLRGPQKIASKLEVIDKGLSILNEETGLRINVSEFFVTPRWNYTAIMLSPKISMILKLLLCEKGLIDRKLHIFNEERLSYNLSEKNLRVIKKPYEYSIFLDFKRRIFNNKDFIYFAKDHYFGAWGKEEPTNFKGLIYKNIIQQLDYSEQLLWYITQPNCKGLLLYDSDPKTYNMGPTLYCPLPVIRVNRTIGEMINKSINDYKVDYYINQNWNESVESYNVIGQIEGKDPTKTVIVCSLYDCLWNQGTADSAIGMSIVLAIAKYYKEHNITPNYNLKFVAFCGEERGISGAYFYEALYRDENIITVIDLNQLGFNQTYTRMRLNVQINNKSLKPKLGEICNRTNYVNRTHNVTDFNIIQRDDGGPSNSQAFANANNLGLRSCNTALFVKEGNWIYHHRDGQKHQEGDVLKYFNWTDTSITGEMIFNVTHYFTNEIQ